nr:hypothetical protein HmN_000920600 [Hymenolepis microstoma]
MVDRYYGSEDGREEDFQTSEKPLKSGAVGLNVGGAQHCLKLSMGMLRLRIDCIHGFVTITVTAGKKERVCQVCEAEDEDENDDGDSSLLL